MSDAAQTGATQSRPSHRFFSVSRLMALSMHTFTQLVRMKVFYFLLIFSAVLFVVGFFFLRFHPEQELKLIKDVSFAFMALFAAIFAIIATAMLIPKDVEDRTLYTILSKPVPRYEYLLGKLFGIIGLIFVSILIMDLLFCAVLSIREEMLVKESTELLLLQASNRPGLAESEGFKAQMQAAEQGIRDHGLDWNIQNAVLAIFLRSCVLAAATLLISTFASTAIFSIILSLGVAIIGMAQGMAKQHFIGIPSMDPLEQIEFEQDVAEGMRIAPPPVGSAGKAIAWGMALVFPDLQLFSITDGVAIGTKVPRDVMLRMVGAALFYLFVYMLMAVLIFWGKEL